MDGAASEAVRGLKAGKDSDLTQIWDALARRFGFLDEAERAMRRFDVRKQQDGESLAVFEQSLRILFREAWPKTDIKSSDADSLLRRRFVDGVADLELQKYLRIHAASDDFASTVSKARHFVDASELSIMPKKPAIRGASPSVNFQAIIDGVKEVVETALHDRGRQAEVHNCQISNQNSKSASKTKKPQARPPSPAASDASSVGSSRVSSSGRTVRFEDQSSDPSNGTGYGSSDRGRWTNRQSGSQGNGDRPRPTGNNSRPGGQGNTRPQPPSSGYADSSFRRRGPRYSPPQFERQWRPGQGGPSYRPPPSGNYRGWRQEWGSSSRDRDEGSSRQPQPPSG